MRGMLHRSYTKDWLDTDPALYYKETEKWYDNAILGQISIIRQQQECSNVQITNFNIKKTDKL